MTSDSSRWHAVTTRRAARRAFIAVSGVESVSLKSVYSTRCRPLKNAFGGLPVRINPGQTVVT